MKRVLAIVLLFMVMLVSVMLASEAQAKKTVEDGWAGKQATCTVSKEGTLTVKGKGSVKLEFKGSDGTYDVKKVIVKEGITRIAEGGISSIYNATEIHLPKSLVSLGYIAFAYNNSLISLRLPDGIRKLSDNVFDHCKKLESIRLPKNLHSIGEEAFCDCISLKSLKISKKVVSIGKDAFKNCKALETLVLPQNLKKFEADFSSTLKLHKVVNRSNKWILLDSAGGKRIWKVDGKKVTKLAPGKTAVTKGVRYRITYALGGGKAKGKLPKYYYYGGKAPKLPEVQKKGYAFLGWRCLRDGYNIPVEFPTTRGCDLKMTAMLVQVKTERVSATTVKFTIKDSVKWDGGSLWKIHTSEEKYDYEPEYVIRIFTKQPEWEQPEQDRGADWEGTFSYEGVSPGESYVFRSLKPQKKYYFEISFRWSWVEEDDPGRCSGWHLRQEVPDWDGIVRPEPPEENKDDNDDEYELYPPEAPKEEENKPITAVSDLVQ